MPPGLPPFHFPIFEAEDHDGKTVGFIEMVENLGTGVIVIPLIAILEDVAIAKAFGKTEKNICAVDSILRLPQSVN